MQTKDYMPIWVIDAAVLTQFGPGEETKVELNVNTTDDLPVEMKTYYDKLLIDMVQPMLVHDQFGQTRNIPRNSGRNIEFRKFAPLPKALTPLVEGVTPVGQKLSVTAITATVKQYGAYIALTDRLNLEALDKVDLETQELLANQAGVTGDTITRDILATGTNVQYGDGMSKYDRSELVGGDEEKPPEGTSYDRLTVRGIKMAVRALANQNAPKINGYYVGIIHPDIAFDLTEDPRWRQPHEYRDTQNLYNGEIGEIAGVRFVTATEAKKIVAPDLASDSRTLSVSAQVTSNTTVGFDGGTVEANALVDREVLIGGELRKVVSNTTTQMVLDEAITADADTVIYPGEAGSEGRDVYATLIIGANAYGVTSIDGGGLEFIAKQRGSGGTADPLNQRSTMGWKMLKTAVILVDQYMVRIETTSTFNDHMPN